MHDLWIFDYNLGILGPYRDRLKIACYIPLDGYIINEADVAQALDNLYYNPDRRQKLAQAAFAASQDPRYSWDAIIEQFNNLFVGLSR
jgi:glycosyltransferase involved in cell wall biosynthesis